MVAITRLADINYRNFNSVGDGVYELRIFYGPGYRVYFGLRGREIIVLLGGGTKSTQRKDIARAKKLWSMFKNETQRYQRKLIT